MILSPYSLINQAAPPGLYPILQLIQQHLASVMRPHPIVITSHLLIMSLSSHPLPTVYQQSYFCCFAILLGYLGLHIANHPIVCL